VDGFFDLLRSHVQSGEVNGVTGRHETDGGLDSVGLAFETLDGPT
jgi:hypothetical protein